MRAGDANGDNQVNVVDFVLLKATFALMCDYAGYDGRADFTGGCVVDASDFTA